eukprot:5823958-Pyramimonas_sp.AAC.1
MMVGATMGLLCRSDRPVGRGEMTRVLLVGVRQQVKKTTEKWGPVPLAHRLCPRVEEVQV